MDCATCVRKIEGQLGGLDGVATVSGSPISRVLDVSYDNESVNAARLLDEVGRLGYAAHVLGAERAPSLSTWTSRRALVTYAAAAAFVSGLVILALGRGPVLVQGPWHDLHLDGLFFVLAALVGGLNFFGKGWRSLRARVLDMNVLMTLAIIGAIAVGEVLEAGAIAFLFSLAELLETFSVDRARASIEALVNLAPAHARVLRGDDEVVVPVAALVVGDRVLVRPGERVPADARVLAGRAAVDESAITGEYLAVVRQEGDPVFGGSVAQDGALEVLVEREADESTLARIIRLVEEAESTKTTTERFVDRFARIYTPVVVLAAVIVAFGPWMFGGDFVVWCVRGLTLLVIACPCALVISTPVAVVSGVTAAARRGVLIKGGTFLEAVGRVSVVAFDKTGTLTHGHPEVLQVLAEPGVSEEELLAVAAAVEAGSEHPVGAGIRRAARGRGLLAAEGPGVTDFRQIPGLGVSAEVDCETWWVGRSELLREVGVTLSDLPQGALEGGGSAVGAGSRERFLGWLILGDTVRVEAQAAVRGLYDAGVPHVAMLTGDNPSAAQAVALRVGIDQVRASLLPEDKVEAVRTLEREFGPVAMVGDGVNDAPALAAATVGIAMGAAGSDSAIETADIALMGDDLGALPYTVELSRRANRVIRQNITAALAVKAILAVGVPLGWVSLVLAVVVGDLGVSLAVTANALRLGRAVDTAA